MQPIGVLLTLTDGDDMGLMFCVTELLVTGLLVAQLNELFINTVITSLLLNVDDPNVGAFTPAFVPFTFH